MENEKGYGIRCKHCGDVIYSEHVHDFKICKCKLVSVDGGMDYLKMGFPNGEPTDHFEVVDRDTKPVEDYFKDQIPNETKPDKCREHDEDCPFFDSHEYCSKCACGDNHDHGQNETKPERRTWKKYLFVDKDDVEHISIINAKTKGFIMDCLGDLDDDEIDFMVLAYNSHAALTADKVRLVGHLKEAMADLMESELAKAYGKLKEALRTVGEAGE